MILGQLFAETVDWDQPLPEQQERLWNEWRKSMGVVQDLNIARLYVKDDNAEILIFSDAPQQAVAAVAYLRTTDGRVSFVLGKAKLAPLLSQTIPRLELCAAVLAVEIGETVSTYLHLDPSTFKYFTDSRIVLGYLNNTIRRFHVYVTNRVERIRKFSSPVQWGYVATHDNSADSATRDSTPLKVELDRWLQGPTKSPKLSLEPFPLLEPDNDKEIRQVVNMSTKVSESLETHRFERFSSWPQLVRAVSRLKHVAAKYSSTTICKSWHVGFKEARTVNFTRETKTFILKLVQSEHYKNEIQCVRANKPLPKRSPLATLYPILDEDGLLRVGGRLNRSHLNQQGKNPIILPRQHYVSLLLVRRLHQAVRHQGRHLTEGAVRAAGYWIVGGKRLISAICHSCVKCRKLRATPSTQLMADHPPHRLSPAPPFTYVGVDTFGHWNVVTRKTRGGFSNSKRWAIVFICLVIRAMHFEIVEEMSASSFINAMRRFTSIRGRVKQFYSDRGTNFLGATTELKIKAINVEDEPVSSYLNTSGIEWIFNPPHSSHMGGS